MGSWATSDRKNLSTMEPYLPDEDAGGKKLEGASTVYAKQRVGRRLLGAVGFKKPRVGKMAKPMMYSKKGKY